MRLKEPLYGLMIANQHFITHLVMFIGLTVYRKKLDEITVDYAEHAEHRTTLISVLKEVDI
jgi:hypothetical protein